ncbi:MAG: hypothetical protein HRT61_21000 [Ekhidna sp.]|nr:hypothetical protein [Ekhidna sp.]
MRQKHNGIYKALRSESLNPEPLKYPRATKYQKVHFCGKVPMKLAKRQFGT